MHSPNGPSSLYRRSLCPGSLRAEQGLSSTETKAAGRGTILHEAIYEHLCGRKPDLEPEHIEAIRSAWIQMLNAINDTPLPGIETDNGATGKTKAGGTWYAERTLQSPATSTNREVGTPDLFIVYPDHIVLIDWKFGDSFVDHPRWNFQLKDYAVSIWFELGLAYPISPVIIQPSAAGFEHNPWIYEYSDRDIMVKQIMDIRDRANSLDAPMVVGPACQFCKARSTCSARAVAAGSIALDLDPLAASPERLNMKLWQLRTLKQMAESRIQDIKAIIESGKAVASGWSIVQFGGAKPHTRLSPDKGNTGIIPEEIPVNEALYQVETEYSKYYVFARNSTYARTKIQKLEYPDDNHLVRAKRPVKIRVVKTKEAVFIQPNQIIR
jgi:Protein of unknown function (DUF2800)